MPIQQWSDEIWVVHLGDEPAFSEELLTLLSDLSTREAIPNLVLDLAGVRRMNSLNVSQMLRLRKLAVSHDARVRVAAPNDAIWAMFLTIGIDKVFEFSEDVPSALASLQLEK